MKAIKHIKAGLLHIEVIGNVPDREGRRQRAGRSRPTSAAQGFYNLKSSWRELELALAANFGARDVVVTLTYDDAHLPADKKQAAEQMRRFFRKIRSVRKLRGQELRYIYVTEGAHGAQEDSYFGGDGTLEDRRIHHHLVINSVGAGDWDELRSLWAGGGYLRFEPLDVHYYAELAKYLTKEAREFGRAKPGERTWRASRNLARAEVEYIEIPSDSVTLSPPPDAVDYRSFHERNPYGFADCVGARYLLFARQEAHEYSYSCGRRKKE